MELDDPADRVSEPRAGGSGDRGRAARPEKAVTDKTEADWYDSGWMITYTGKHFYPLDPDPALITLEDIAHALANICR